MDSKQIRCPRRISFGPIRGPHRGPCAWEIEPTPQEADESQRRQAELALLYCEPLPAEEITAVMESYRRSLEQMVNIAIFPSQKISKNLALLGSSRLTVALAH